MAFPTGLRESSGLLIEKTVPAEVLAGQKFDYTYKVSNLTDYTIHMVTLSDRVTSNFSSAEADPKPTDTRDGVATWQLGTLGPKETKTVKIKGSSAAEGAVRVDGAVAFPPSTAEFFRLVIARVRRVAPGALARAPEVPSVQIQVGGGHGGIVTSLPTIAHRFDGFRLTY